MQQLTLKAAGYISCVEADKGKLVTDDTVTIGVLWDFVNSTRIWIIDTPNTILVNSVMAITGGTGAGTAYSDSVLFYGYCIKDVVKDRVLIPVADTSYDTPLDVAINEASRLVDIFLKPYTNVPLANPDSQIAAITGDFAASIFKRRMLPDELKIRGEMEPVKGGEIDASSWFAQAIAKLERYIKSYFILAETLGNTAHNPDIYINMVKAGIITGKEARTFINTASAIALKRTEDITKTLATTETVTRDITEATYKTKKQKSMVFVSGKPDEDTYEVDSEYYG